MKVLATARSTGPIGRGVTCSGNDGTSVPNDRRSGCLADHRRPTWCGAVRPPPTP